MVSWFGKRHNAPIYEDTPQVTTPVGKKCLNCDEPILQGEDGFVECSNNAFHRACFLRRIIGSLAHQMGVCSCYKGGSELHDPPGLTKREAAEAALAYHEYGQVDMPRKPN